MTKKLTEKEKEANKAKAAAKKAAKKETSSDAVKAEKNNEDAVAKAKEVEAKPRGYDNGSSVDFKNNRTQALRDQKEARHKANLGNAVGKFYKD